MQLNKKTKAQIVYFLLAILWGSLIFYLSNQPDLSSGLPTIYDFILRKVAHVTVFAILAYFVASIFMKTSRPYLIFVIFASIAYALTDEIHQLSVHGRSGNARDILIDSAGVAIGIYFFERQHLFHRFNNWTKKILR